MSDYGWIITHELDLDHFDSTNGDRRWVPAITRGPHDISEELLHALEAGEGEPFMTYDDDGIPYHKGRAVGNIEGHEPLSDFSGPSSGATWIKWPNRRELDSEW